MINRDNITLPRSVVEQALEAWEQARGALAYVAVGNAPSNPNPARSTCSQAVWVLDNAELALRAALEQPQVEQEPVAWQGRDGYLYHFIEEPKLGDRPLYAHPQNLNCKSTQHRLATLWGYEKPQPPRQPLTCNSCKGLGRVYRGCNEWAACVHCNTTGIGGEK